MTLQALFDVPAPAKLNLFLHVVGRRPDGYHLLQSLFVPIDWSDTLHFERRSDGRLARHDLGDPLPAEDLCLRAARALQAACGTTFGADISIDKRVPSGAGMGGGSSDAATTLLALNRLWSLGLDAGRLAAIGVQLGADVPFFLGPGPALVEGIGERLTPVDLPPQWFAVVKPAAGLDTATVFRSPQLGRTPEAARIEGFTGDGESMLSARFVGGKDLWTHGRNDLQAAAEAACPEVAATRAWLAERFGNARMTGSGSAVLAWAGGGAEPAAVLPDVLPEVLGAGRTGRMCRSLAAHPLTGWAA
jgi:4-diphosphocytidyl-2-C-methyl-D-erythritol kinase